jgi:hypothetical protein
MKQNLLPPALPSRENVFDCEGGKARLAITVLPEGQSNK